MTFQLHLVQYQVVTLCVLTVGWKSSWPLAQAAPIWIRSIVWEKQHSPAVVELQLKVSQVLFPRDTLLFQLTSSLTEQYFLADMLATWEGGQKESLCFTSHCIDSISLRLNGGAQVYRYSGQKARSNWAALQPFASLPPTFSAQKFLWRNAARSDSLCND